MKRTVKTITAMGLLCACTAAGQTLRSAAEPDYPPLSIARTNGVADGFSVELLKAALSEVGMEASFKVAPWNQIKRELAEGNLDVLPLVGRTPEREALFDFTMPYLTLHGALFVRSDETAIRRLGDLDGKRVAVMKGDNAEEYVLRAKLSDRIISTPTFEEAFQMLAAGEADAVIAQKLMGVSLLQKLDIGNIKVVGQPNEEFTQEFCFAVPEGRTHLLRKLDEGLAILAADGTLHTLKNRWLGSIRYQVAAARALIYAGDRDYPPFEFTDAEGRPAGFNIDLARALARQTGLNILFEMMPWPHVRERAARGEVDLISMYYSPERDRSMDFSTPVLVAGQAVFARSDSPPYSSFAALKTASVAVQEGDLAHDLAQQEGFQTNLVLTAHPQEALAQLAAGRVDFAVCSLLQGHYWIQKKGWKSLQAVEPQLQVSEYCFAVPEGRRDLLNLINKGLADLNASGEYRRIYNKWLAPVDPAAGWQRFRRVLAAAGGIALTAGLLAALWIFSLRRQVQKQTAVLAAGEERLQLAAAAGGIGIWDRDIVNDTLIWDDRMVELYGIRKKDFGGAYEAWQQCLHPDDRERAAAEVAAAEQGEKPFDTEFRIIRADNGETRHIRAFGKVIFDEQGQALRMIGTNQDITPLKNSFSEMIESEKKFKALYDNAPLSYQSLDKMGCFLDVNPMWLKTLGYKKEEVLGKRYADLLHPDWKPHFETNFPAFKKHGYVHGVQFKIRHKDGHYLDVEFEGCVGYNPDGSFRQTYCVFQDITKRKKAEAKTKRLVTELQRFNKYAVGRELRMTALKKEINKLCRELGREQPYPLQSEG